MITDTLYSQADSDGIEVLCGAHLPLTKSVSLNMDNKMFIGIDDTAMQTSAEERVHLAHEMGHCETGAFYSLYSPIDNRHWCENKANIWAIHKLIDQDILCNLIKSRDGEIGVWELADYFDVTESFMNMALEYYFT